MMNCIDFSLIEFNVQQLTVVFSEKVPDYSHEGETSNGPDSGGARESDIGQADFNAHRRCVS